MRPLVLQSLFRNLIVAYSTAALFSISASSAAVINEVHALNKIKYSLDHSYEAVDNLLNLIFNTTYPLTSEYPVTTESTHFSTANSTTEEVTRTPLENTNVITDAVLSTIESSHYSTSETAETFFTLFTELTGTVATTEDNSSDFSTSFTTETPEQTRQEFTTLPTTSINTTYPLTSEYPVTTESTHFSTANSTTEEVTRTPLENTNVITDAVLSTIESSHYSTSETAETFFTLFTELKSTVATTVDNSSDFSTSFTTETSGQTKQEFTTLPTTSMIKTFSTTTFKTPSTLTFNTNSFSTELPLVTDAFSTTPKTHFLTDNPTIVESSSSPKQTDEVTLTSTESTLLATFLSTLTTNKTSRETTNLITENSTLTKTAATETNSIPSPFLSMTPIHISSGYTTPVTHNLSMEPIPVTTDYETPVQITTDSIQTSANTAITTVEYSFVTEVTQTTNTEINMSASAMTKDSPETTQYETVASYISPEMQFTVTELNVENAGMADVSYRDVWLNDESLSSLSSQHVESAKYTTHHNLGNLANLDNQAVTLNTYTHLHGIHEYSNKETASYNTSTSNLPEFQSTESLPVSTSMSITNSHLLDANNSSSIVALHSDNAMNSPFKNNTVPFDIYNNLTYKHTTNSHNNKEETETSLTLNIYPSISTGAALTADNTETTKTYEETLDINTSNLKSMMFQDSISTTYPSNFTSFIATSATQDLNVNKTDNLRRQDDKDNRATVSAVKTRQMLSLNSNTAWHLRILECLSKIAVIIEAINQDQMDIVHANMLEEESSSMDNLVSEGWKNPSVILVLSESEIDAIVGQGINVSKTVAETSSRIDRTIIDIEHEKLVMVSVVTSLSAVFGVILLAVALSFVVRVAGSPERCCSKAGDPTDSIVFDDTTAVVGTSFMQHTETVHYDVYTSRRVQNAPRSYTNIALHIIKEY